MTHWINRCAAILVAWGVMGAACAAYPDKPIQFVVPFPPGGVADLIARSVGQKAGELLGQPLIIENKAGASAIIGTGFVARSRADGYTLLLANLPVMAINPLQFSNLPYDAAHDLAPIVLLANQPYIIAAAPSVGASTLRQFIDLAKNQSNHFTFGSASSSTFLAGELFKRRAGIQMTHVPYKGSAPAINDLLGGHISLLIDPVITLAPHAKSGNIVALAITSRERSPIAPDIPTYVEAGMDDMDITSWQGVVAPAGTPAAVIQKLNEAFNAALRDPGVVAQLQSQGVKPVGGTPDDFVEFVGKERKRWTDIAKQADFKPTAP